MRRLLLPPAWVVLLTGPGAAAEPVDYARDVRPIFARHCTACHGPAKQRSGLRLDTASGALRGGDSGPVVLPGKSSASKLIHAVSGTGDAAVMPPKGARLTAAEVAVLSAWIEQGAKVPAGETSVEVAVPRSEHWAFRPVSRPAPPAVRQSGWVRNPIDRFILAALEAKGLSPSPEADRVTLIRRLSLDLVGLPPTPAEVDAFVHDPRPDAYEYLVERLLASPHYGERWGRHWLDLARYADSNGYNADQARSIWKYRDWVIESLNEDLPFDRFTVEQLAGDLLPGATVRQRVATGFHRNSMFNDEGGTDREQSRVEGIVDRVHTTATVWLGLTAGCAQCHDHKYDPISQREYYQLYAFFNTSDEPTLELGPPEVLARRDALRAQLAPLQKELASYDQTLLARQPEWEKSLTAEARRLLKPEVQAVLALPPAERSTKQQKLLADAFKTQDPGRAQRQEAITRLQQQMPPVVTTLVIQEQAQPRPTHLHVRGDFLRKGVEVFPGVPAVLPPLPAGSAGARPSRLDLARWLVRPDNPLTARVAVNRLWQQYFGVGLVETSNDFGTQGTPPSHPELLDWLALEFMASARRPAEVLEERFQKLGRAAHSTRRPAEVLEERFQKLGRAAHSTWSLKALHRLIVTSATYRQSSRYRPELREIDPRNRLLARQARLRLEAEVIRDVALASSGLLVPAVGGPSVFPPQPDGLDAFARTKKGWKADTGPGRHRRGMYTWFWRSLPHPGLTVFDAPESTTTCTRRNRSTTPLQALTLANDQAFFECAQALAARVLREAGPDDAARIRHAFRLCLAPQPDDGEVQAVAGWLAGHRRAFAAAPKEARALVPARAGDAIEPAAWTLVARVLLNLDEFITRE